VGPRLRESPYSSAETDAMKNHLLLAIIIFPIVIAARAAKAKDPKQGFRKFVRNTVLFNVAYGLMLAFIWGRL
jgi:hypothetical protein